MIFMVVIPRHWFSTHRHQTYVSAIYATRDISFWMRYVLFDLEFPNQRWRSRYWYICFWIQWHWYSTYRHQTQISTIYTTKDISFLMRYVLCDLEFQGQRSRSRYWYISFWIPRHRCSTYRHQTQVSTIYTARDIILHALRHVWPWISRLKVKVTTMRPIFLNFLTSI